MSNLSSVLHQINESLLSTSESLESLKKQYEQPASESTGVRGRVIKDILKKNGEVDKVSLLSLKNGSLLAYLNSLVQVVGEKLSRQDMTAAQGRNSSVEHRVVLERGVRPLEKQLAYQLEKLTRAYTRMETEYAAAEKRAMQKQEQKLLNGDGNSSEDGSGSSEEDSEDESMSFRPNAAALMNDAKKTGRKTKSSDQPQNGDDNNNNDNDDEAESSTYKPPKISAMLPPRQNHFEDKFDAQQHKDRSGRSRMQAMDEYVREMSEQPEWEASVGTNILNHGKGGIKSSRDAEKEQRVKNFEEENFTRLNLKGNKMERRKAKQRERASRVNMIGGEDFSIFNSKRKLEGSTSRKATKKPRGVWDRAKTRL
ncbi:LAME_0H16006g1_1 [Lachancea meyersii CBS 8951]|uniref:LAME_0H16006g1_1 n=1 Tax=Lachancea meyersii CBS 8951 TaxID=1266667 RepID=A0A1G4KHT5_9SACH|nr:LAME_0H16006g1_1 [Lachancea meyersii CBS 8951]